MPLLTVADYEAAQRVVYSAMPPTPQYAWPLLARRAGAEVWVKHENHTPTGAFKVRGGLVYAERLRAGRPGVKGIVSATRGNHGQSLAFAGRAAGVGVTIVVPEGNSPDKNAAMCGFGAELIVHGRDYQSSREHAAELGAQRGLETVPPFHPDLVLGVASGGLGLPDGEGESAGSGTDKGEDAKATEGAEVKRRANIKEQERSVRLEEIEGD